MSFWIYLIFGILAIILLIVVSFVIFLNHHYTKAKEDIKSFTEFENSESKNLQVADKKNFNPSGIKYKDYFLVTSRNQFRYKRKIKTENFLTIYDKNFNIIKTFDIFLDNSIEQPKDVNIFIGLEDLRIFKYNEDTKILQITFSSCSFSENGNPKSYYGEITFDENMINDKKVKHVYLTRMFKMTDKSEKEKNHVLLEKEEKVYEFYHSDPYTIHELDLKSGRINKLIEEKIENLKSYKLSSHPVKYKNGKYLMGVHTFRNNFMNNYYVNRLVLINEDTLKPEKLSRPFKFKDVDSTEREQNYIHLEYVNSLYYDKSEDKVYIFYGTMDKKADVVAVSSMDIDKLFE
jgi:hypothetical protein